MLGLEGLINVKNTAVDITQGNASMPAQVSRSGFASMSLRRKIPPLSAITAFEAAARLLSVTKAAAELGVTQAAVSRQIHVLEEHLGFSLFVRLHRRIELTEKGRALASAAQEAYDRLETCVAEITRDDQELTLTISATVAFSHFWLLPRISEFSRLHPDVNLRIMTQDAMPNIDTSDLDVAIRFGNGSWPDGRARLLFEDEVFPVCSPDFLRTADAVSSPGDLLAHPLISNMADDPTWTGWKEWFATYSVDFPRKHPGLRCSFYTDAIYAALNSQGIALGWRRLVEDLLDQGRLVRLTDASLRTKDAYFAVVPRKRHESEATARFLAWLEEYAGSP